MPLHCLRTLLSHLSSPTTPKFCASVPSATQAAQRLRRQVEPVVSSRCVPFDMTLRAVQQEMALQ